MPNKRGEQAANPAAAEKDTEMASPASTKSADTSAVSVRSQKSTDSADISPDPAAPGKRRSGRRLSENARPNKRNRTTKLLKSLITLDSYEQDIADNVQGEEFWNENSTDIAPPGNSTSSKASAGSDSSDGSLKVSTQEFAAQEAERAAQLPEKYRKFRPMGYGFKLPPTDRPVRIYADGVFDLFHLGHMRQLEQAKKSLPNVTMVVGVPSDELTHKYKGLTVLSDEQRVETLKHCRWVDEVVPNAPWSVDQEFIDKHKIDYVAHDDIPYQSAGADDVYKFAKEKGIFLTTQRTEGISTSDIITKIIRDYDLYLMRNFERGVSRKDLNVSWLKKNEIDLKRHVNQFRESFMHNVENTTRDFYADFMALMASRQRRHENDDNDGFQSSFQGGSGSPGTGGNTPNRFLGSFRDWVQRVREGSATPSVQSDQSELGDESDDRSDDRSDDGSAESEDSDAEEHLKSPKSARSRSSASASLRSARSNGSVRSSGKTHLSASKRANGSPRASPKATPKATASTSAKTKTKAT